MSITSLFFPAEPRSLPGRRGLKILLRAAHVLCSGVLTGGYVFDVASARPGHWVMATLISGAAILLLDLHETGIFLLQMRGWFVVAKLAAVALVPRIEPTAAAWLLGALVVGSVVSSHAPSRVRYFIPFGGGRFTGATTKG